MNIQEFGLKIRNKKNITATARSRSPMRKWAKMCSKREFIKM